jgi:hypothetical protein
MECTTIWLDRDLYIGGLQNVQSFRLTNSRLAKIKKIN